MSTISLGLSKKIHEAAKEKGVELPSPSCVESMYIVSKESYVSPGNKCLETDVINCFATDELLEMLPTRLDTFYFLNIGKTIYKSYRASYDADDEHMVMFIGDTPSEALSKMLLYLIENDLFTPIV